MSQHSLHRFRSCCCPVSKFAETDIHLYLDHDVAPHKAPHQMQLYTKDDQLLAVLDTFCDLGICHRRLR